MARGPDLLADLISLLRWYRILRRVRPLAVSVGTPKAGLLGSVAARAARVPVRVYLIRGLRLQTTSGGRRRLLRILERIAVRSATRVLSVSQSLSAALLEEGVRPRRGTIETVGAGSSNGVDTGRFDPGAVDRSAARRAWAIPDEARVVAFVGRLTEDKGLGTLIAAMEHPGVIAQRPILLVIGDVDDETGVALRERLTQSPVTSIVLPADDRPELVYAAADIVCLPSKREGLPNVVLEASSMALPVIGSDVTGVVDAIRDEQTGIITPVGDDAALASALVRLLGDPLLRRRLGAAGRAWMQADFERRVVQARYAYDLDKLIRNDRHVRLGRSG